MSDSATSQISEAMNRLWLKFQPQMEERVTTLQAAAARMGSGAALSPEEKSCAISDAHKLAGVLGTFGLQEGTELAREAEGLFEATQDGNLDGNPINAARLVLISDRLKAIIASRV